MLRYSRQMILPDIGKEGQKVLLKSKVCIVGVGALGSVVLTMLARAGIGRIIVIDDDIVRLHNLQRQILYDMDDLGMKKADIAARKIEKTNPDIKITAYDMKINSSNTDIMNSDIIIGCTDNIESRFLINEYAVKNKTPWVNSGCVSTYGNMMNIIPGDVCFRCVFDKGNDDNADTIGILNTIVPIIGGIQATEALKILLGKEYEKKLIYYNARNNEFKKIEIRKNPMCPVCSSL